MAAPTASENPYGLMQALQEGGLISWTTFIILVIILYLILGTFLTPSEIILVTVPITAIAKKLRPIVAMTLGFALATFFTPVGAVAAYAATGVLSDEPRLTRIGSGRSLAIRPGVPDSFARPDRRRPA